MSTFKSTEAGGIHSGPQAWEDDPAANWGFDLDFEVDAVLEVVEPGYASPHAFAIDYDGTAGAYGFAYTQSDFGDQSELWWRIYLDTNILSGRSADDGVIITYITDAAETGGIFVYYIYDASGDMSVVAYYDTSFTHLAYTAVVPDGTGFVCYEGHYVNSATVGALEGWADGTAFDFETTGANTSAVGDVGDEVYVGAVSAFGGTPPGATHWMRWDHWASSTVGRLNTYEERDTKLVTLANIGQGHAPVAAAALGGVLTL